MAPGRSSVRRAQTQTHPHAHHDLNAHNNVQPVPVVEPAINKDDIFLEPMMGTPQAIYVEKDVDNRDQIVSLITKHGGVVSPGYSGVPYILVDPYKESGQNLYRQYAGKKGKIVLSANWVYECVKAGELQTYVNSWAGCKVTGQEKVISMNNNVPGSEQAGPADPHLPPVLVQSVQPAQIIQQQSVHANGLPPPITAAATDPLAPHHDAAFAYAFQGGMHAPPSAPPQTWQTPGAIAPQQTHMQPSHMIHRPPPPQTHYRDEQSWAAAGYHQHPPPAEGIVPNVPSGYDYRDYREEQPNWVATATEYYQQQYDHPYAPEPEPYIEAGPSTNGDSSSDGANNDQRGRKRARMQSQPAPAANTLVSNRKNPPARSPTPPTRVIKSTYGGNLFTAEDVEYLKKYIDYCQEQGLVLSLREICERIAIKAPHHTFYSWRRYCNKHQIRLGGYAMDVGDEGDDAPQGEEMGHADGTPQVQPVTSGVGPITITAAKQAAAADTERTRSPTPPRALFRSTTGKGVAFTDEDVTFLVRFLEYRTRTHGTKVDMVAFWKDVAAKAPHHSRASWMKFYRRHKHELNHEDGDEPLPLPPEKKMRYSRSDDVLLAKFFHERPEGTSDKVFQMFARQHPHHPWKGWQEHHRIHKAKIDYLIQKLRNGETIESDEDP